MELTHAASTPRSAVVIALGGCCLLGASLGLRGGVMSAGVGMLEMPLIFVGIPLLMLPALYVGSAVLGQAPAARDFLAGCAQGLRSMGALMLGLVPAALFLMASTPHGLAAYFVAQCMVILAAAVGLRATLRALRGHGGPRLQGIFALWALLMLAIANHFLIRWISRWPEAL